MEPILHHEPCILSRKLPFLLGLAILTHSASPLAAQAPTSPPSLSAWVRALVGTWSCAGAFASGKPLAADLTFTPTLGGRWLTYHHQDRPPGQYEAHALLGPATQDSAPAQTLLYDNFGGHRRFYVASSAAMEVTLLRDTTIAGARLERFTFRPRSDGSLWFGWEVGRQGSWTLGDSLSCHR